MYRVFCDSYDNYIKSFRAPDVRLSIAEPLGLVANVDRFNAARISNSWEYKQLCDLLHYASQNIPRYPRLEAFLWTVSSRGMLPVYFGESDELLLEEQVKLIDSFLKLAYWE